MSTRGNTEIAGDNSLPEGWKWATLGDVSEKSQYGWTTKANHDTGRLKLLRTTDITSGSIDWSSVPYCTDEPEDVEKYLLESGDVLISRAGSVGVSFLINKPERAVFASYLIRFRPKKEILTKYFYHYLKSPAYWGAIGASKSGIAVPNVNASKLSQVPIPVAPGVFQGSCRVDRFHYAAFRHFITNRSGLSMTNPIGVQSRVFPDHRSGRFAFATS